VNKVSPGEGNSLIALPAPDFAGSAKKKSFFFLNAKKQGSLVELCVYVVRV
jgi:hypothetical protein